MKVEWVSKPCVVPATFRVTLTNTGNDPFWMPRLDTLGRGRTVNLTTNDGRTTENYFGPPPPTAYSRSKDFTRVMPNRAHSFTVDFDGSFEAHGPPSNPVKAWDGSLRFEYTLDPPSEFGPPPKFGPILIRNDANLLVSNVLRCGASAGG